MFSKIRLLKFIQNHYFLLLVITISYYSIYFSHIFLNLNNLLSSSTDDSLKNYFTYVFQIKNSPSVLHFTGFNYPFGEHVVYTDCQPLLTFILRQFPFTFDYSIGILHFLMFASIILCPLIYLNIFRSLKFPTIASFAISLSITILSPQYFRIYCGHYALAYACIIPFSVLLLLKYYQSKKSFIITILFVYNTLLFLIHPYYGLGISLFCFIFLLFMIYPNKGKRLKFLCFSLIVGILPIIIFRIFMGLSDLHSGRSPEPFGNDNFISELSSFLVPAYGPLSEILTKIVGSFPKHFEGYSYLGLGFNLILLLSFPLLILFYKKIKINWAVLGLLISSIFFLLFSFGTQYKLQELLGVKIHALNQFRAMGRFSWFAYYILPITLFHLLFELAKQKHTPNFANRTINLLAIIYLGLNLYEGDTYFKIYDGAIWEDRNVFNPEQLNEEEKYLIKTIKDKKAQAILPLPTFYIGSEIYERSNPTGPMFLSSIYSYHSGLPIISSCMSRTSVSETRSAINILNSYRKNRLISDTITKGTFFVIRTQDPLYEDEKRAWKITEQFFNNDSTNFGYLRIDDLQKPILDTNQLEIKNINHYTPETKTVIYLGFANRKPYLKAKANDYEMLYVSDIGAIKTGTYIFSFHYHTNEKTYNGTANSLVVAKKRGEEYNWQDVISLKNPSGFGNGYSIIEREITIDETYGYEFFINSSFDFEYSVSNFLLRPYNTSIRLITAKNDTIYNNYPK